MTRNWVNKILILCLHAILVSLNTLAQSTAHIEFDRYTTNDGLSNGYINTILHDSKGFIWIGTSNGLNRFDGISFKNYYFNPKDTTSLPGSAINNLAEDANGNIWVMTSNGLCVYDRKKDNFSRKVIFVNEMQLIDYYLNTCLLDKEGYLWVGAASLEVFRFKIYDNPEVERGVIHAEAFVINEDDCDPYYRNNVFAMAEDDQGKIWLASFSNKLFYLDRAQNKFISQSIKHPEAENFSNKRKGMFKDSSGALFVTIEDVGLLYFNTNREEFTLYKSSSTGNGPNGKVLFALAEDESGNLWIGDRNAAGITIMDKKTGNFSYLQADKWNPYSILANKVNCIHRDNVGKMWVGTITGMNKYSPGKTKFKRYFSNANLPDKLGFNNTLCFEEGRGDVIWIGTDGGGLNKLDRKTDRFIYYEYENGKANSLSSNAIISICEDHEGTLWMGTFHGGLAKMKNGKFSAYLPNPANPYTIASRNVWYVMEDSKKNLWVANLSNGLDLFDRKTEKFYHYTYQGGDTTSLCNNTIHGLYEDSNQNLYITTTNGVSVLDLKAYDFSKLPLELKFTNLKYSENNNGLSSIDINCAMEDQKGIIWFGTTGSGLDRYDPVSKQFTNYSTKDGLPGNSISSILVDSLNNLWLATDQGLAKFNPETKSIKVFDAKDGLQNKSLKGWALKTTDGEMYFGGAEGFNSFYPESLRDNLNQNKPKVVITGLKIFNHTVSTNELFNGRVLLENDITETQELVLTNKENFFSFEFIALDFNTPEKNKYAYQMEGFDENWIECETEREANYTNLDPGEYVFRVKASNNDGIWNEEGTSIKVIILPPWWATWWFRILMVLIFVLILVGGYYYRIRRFKQHEMLLKKKVAQKTYELRQMNSVLIKQAEELNQTNMLLEERQKQIEGQSEELSAQQESLININKELHNLNVTKDKFFSIIAHDIKNPFSAIMAFSNLLEENYKDWTDDMKLEIINLIQESAKNLYQLLENLLQWSRSQRGAIEFNPETVDLNGLIQNVIGLMKGTAEAKNINFEVALAENAVAVQADKQMLNTILRNLIGNGVKFTNNGGKVQIISEAVNEYVKIHIADNGIGMDKDVKDNLFKLDTAFTSAGTANETGTGLGLILVKEFIEKHGGNIEVESEPGNGSTFHFTLPKVKELL